MSMRLWVDFNEIERDRYIEADLEFADFFLESELVEGTRADLFDGAGHGCQATVVEVDQAQGLVKLLIDWETWTSPARQRMWEPTGLSALLHRTWNWSLAPDEVV